jgi:hypothetical protein
MENASLVDVPQGVEQGRSDPTSQERNEDRQR